ncbi:Protein transport protein Sec61 subunit alpha [Halocynthia roretzi] [Rhizoctonia solani]|uniref:Protein transport protein Sec61 subunit alpha [Halocynthia roretzi] n=1 Tax=Rhizoctonia solani TaxID=456999 RepID=A0A0K6FUF2_9AGAM|nr:Protein transport protein Sec61 subunit alpha [Halocynthia roretzi] [Rhizoctonia solani]
MPSYHMYACSGCPRTFKYENSLKRHRIKAHTSQQNTRSRHRDDICTWCSVQFSPSGLQRHLEFHKVCSRLEKAADGEATDPILSSNDSSDSDSDSDASHLSDGSDTSGFWDTREATRQSEPATRADDMESVHYDNDPDHQQNLPRESSPTNTRPRNPPDPAIHLKKEIDSEGFEVFVESFPCAHAGQPIRPVDPNQQARGKYPDVGALADRDAFEIAQLLMESGVSARFRNRYLRLKRLRKQMPWSNNRAMLKDIDKLPHGPDWEVQPFRLTGNSGEEVVELWKRNPLDVIRALLRDKTLRRYLHYVPQRHYTTRDRQKRRLGELWTADWMWKVQRLIEDEFATIISCIISSDETRLTNFAGDKKAHPVYFTIGNLPKRLRRRISKRTTVLIGYLPVPKLSCETRKDKRREIKRDLFHTCLASILKPLADACKDGGVEMPCSDGGVRRIYPVLASYVADFPEQCKVACTKQTHCPLCTTYPKTRGDPGDSPLRDRQDTLDTMNEQRRGPSARFNWLGLTHNDPFWAEHKYVDIGSFLTPDLLHQVHKGVMKDHLIKWVTTILGKPLMDERYISMPESHGMRHFKHGISSVSQWTGRELKEMSKILLPAMADSNQRVVKAARALLDFMYLVHLGSMTDDDLDDIEEALRTFHNCKDVFKELGTVATDSGFHGIPKIHMISHYVHLIRELGTPDGYNTETSERLHIDFAKLGYRASNKVNATKQMALYIQRLEAIEMHDTYLSETPENSAPVGAMLPNDADQGPLGVEQGRYGDDLEGDEDDEWDTWFDEEDEDGSLEELADAGLINVKATVDFGGKTREQQRGKLWEEVAQPLRAEEGVISPTFYPNPEQVLAKTPTTTASAAYIVREHGAQHFLPAIKSFVRKELPQHPPCDFDHETAFNIWSRARLYHYPPPFQPSEGPRMDVVRSQPPKIDEFGRVSRPARFDTVMLLAFPDRSGMHCYRPGRVRVIFELPAKLRKVLPEPLVYVELFNPPSAQPSPTIGLFTTSRTAVEGQHAALVLDETPLTLATDSLQIFKTFYINIFTKAVVVGRRSALTTHSSQGFLTRAQEFYHLSVACAMESGASLNVIRNEFTIELCNGETKLFSQATAWELLNLKPETVFDIPERLQNEYAISAGALSAALNPYLIQTCGKDVLKSKFNIKPSKYFVGTTKHHSWPKGAAVTGIGSEHILDVPVDIDARMDISKLDQQLHQCLVTNTPVFAVVAVMGSTEHGAVNPIKGVVQLRTKYQALRLLLAVHADAAWGGHYASFLHEPEVPQSNGSIVPEQALSDYTRSQLEYPRFVDSITINPLSLGISRTPLVDCAIATDGYGFGSGVLLFIATNICKSIVWKAFSPTIVNTSHGPKFEGTIVALFHMIFTWNDKATDSVVNAALTPSSSFTPPTCPSCMLESALTSNVYILSQMLFNRFPDNFLVRLLGVWEPLEDSQQLMAKSGIVYYMSPPRLP